MRTVDRRTFLVDFVIKFSDQILKVPEYIKFGYLCVGGPMHGRLMSKECKTNGLIDFEINGHKYGFVDEDEGSPESLYFRLNEDGTLPYLALTQKGDWLGYIVKWKNPKEPVRYIEVTNEYVSRL